MRCIDSRFNFTCVTVLANLLFCRPTYSSFLLGYFAYCRQRQPGHRSVRLYVHVICRRFQVQFKPNILAFKLAVFNFVTKLAKTLEHHIARLNIVQNYGTFTKNYDNIIMICSKSQQSRHFLFACFQLHESCCVDGVKRIDLVRH